MLKTTSLAVFQITKQPIGVLILFLI